MQNWWQKISSPSSTGWALLLAILAGIMTRFWQLGTYPPGLYRDEAFNGLDALGVLNGQHAIFFTANNGREPGYIYLTAVAITFLGRSPLAVRLAAAVVGSITTFVVYLLGKSWFGKQTAVYAAWLWAITLWPIHLSRIGLRPILLPIMLGFTFWLGTKAYRQKSVPFWLLAGLCYGLSFYTYLAVRFTPLLLIFILLSLWWIKRPLPAIKHLLTFSIGAITTLLPLLLWIAQDPSRFLGRSNQVSILNPIINDGSFWGTLWQHSWRGLGLFFWQGDNILRHNPAGRPVFDWVMAIPFIIGVIICIVQWKRPSKLIILLWTATMLGPTILAEDTPHFLRAVGILPAIIYLPAIGLTAISGSAGQQSDIHNSQFTIYNLQFSLRSSFLSLIPPSLIALSLLITLANYRAYSQDPEVALLFEAGALELAQDLKAEEEGTAVYLDRWFWDEEHGGWPSIPFIADLRNITPYRPEFNILPPAPHQPVSIYSWQFGALDFVPTLINAPAIVNIKTGPLARGDLEENAYPLYVRYQAFPTLPNQAPIAQFEDQFKLLVAHAGYKDDELIVSLWWEAETAVSQPWHVFTHLVGATGLVAQDDGLPTKGVWQFEWWQPGLQLLDVHTFSLTPDFDPTTHYVLVGLYDPATNIRLQASSALDVPLGDSWRITLDERP